MSLMVGRIANFNMIIDRNLFFPACVECGVSRLVYTSTYNVVFAGQEIRNGDHLEILPDHKVSRVPSIL